MVEEHIHTETRLFKESAVRYNNVSCAGEPFARPTGRSARLAATNNQRSLHHCMHGTAQPVVSYYQQSLARSAGVGAAVPTMIFIVNGGADSYRFIVTSSIVPKRDMSLTEKTLPGVPAFFFCDGG